MQISNLNKATFATCYILVLHGTKIINTHPTNISYLPWPCKTRPNIYTTFLLRLTVESNPTWICGIMGEQSGVGADYLPFLHLLHWPVLTCQWQSAPLSRILLTRVPRDTCGEGSNYSVNTQFSCWRNTVRLFGSIDIASPLHAPSLVPVFVWCFSHQRQVTVSPTTRLPTSTRTSEKSS